jgi:hypothetical protein
MPTKIATRLLRSNSGAALCISFGRRLLNERFDITRAIVVGNELREAPVEFAEQEIIPFLREFVLVRALIKSYQRSPQSIDLLEPTTVDSDKFTGETA